jgi:hypothetical protein
MIATEGWADPSCITFEEPIVQKLAFKLALLIIARCSFGFDSFSWGEEPANENGEMSIQQSLRVLGDTIIAAISMPKWCWKLPVGW